MECGRDLKHKRRLGLSDSGTRRVVEDNKGFCKAKVKRRKCLLFTFIVFSLKVKLAVSGKTVKGVLWWESFHMEVAFYSKSNTIFVLFTCKSIYITYTYTHLLPTKQHLNEFSYTAINSLVSTP